MFCLGCQFVLKQLKTNQVTKIMCLGAYLWGHLLQWFQFFGRHQIKLLHKIVEMLVACIHMCFSINHHNIFKVMNVHMHKYSVQPRKDFTAVWGKILWKWKIRCAWKQCLIINLILNPVHQMRNIFSSWKWRGFLVFMSISPEVLKPWTTRHCWTCCLRTVFWYSTVD